jgi:hypothetical protein
VVVGRVGKKKRKDQSRWDRERREDWEYLGVRKFAGWWCEKSMLTAVCVGRVRKWKTGPCQKRLPRDVLLVVEA